jgi:hypothetical protein
MAEIIDISNIESRDSKSSTNFGGGIELLMNDKKSKNSENKDLEILNLENELNSLTVDSEPTNFVNDIPKVNFKIDNEKPQSIGDSIKNVSSNNDEKTWDGFSKFNEIPINPDVHVPENTLSAEEILKEKFSYLRKLEQLEQKGVQLTKKYTMESSLMEMMGEYELLISEKEKENSIKFQGNMLSALINGIEFLNGKFDPFDFKLDGWGEQFNENISDYDEIFGELHDKYKGNAKMAPEIKLVFQLAASGMMVHMTNTMFKSAMPNMDDIMRQNPDLMQQFNNAAVNSMGKTNPGFSGFMNNIMNPEPKPTNMGPPPKPIETKETRFQSRNRNENVDFINRRPDLNASQDGINLNASTLNNIHQPKEPPKPIEKSFTRPEMKGPTMKPPSDISNLLGGLKSIVPPSQNNINLDVKDLVKEDKEDSGSTISISELKELQNEGKMPSKKGGKRKQKSDKNTISLDI